MSEVDRNRMGHVEPVAIHKEPGKVVTGELPLCVDIVKLIPGAEVQPTWKSVALSTKWKPMRSLA